MDTRTDKLLEYILEELKALNERQYECHEKLFSKLDKLHETIAGSTLDIELSRASLATIEESCGEISYSTKVVAEHYDPPRTR